MSAPACASATASILFNCDEPLTGGTETTAYIMNRSEIVEATKDEDNPLIISAFMLDAYATAFKLEGNSGENGSSLRPRFKMVKLPYGKAFEHEIDALAFKIDPATKLQLERWMNADLVLIAPNKHRGADGNSAFEVFGLDGGLQFDEFQRDPNNKDTLGAFEIKFKTQESSREGHMPYTFWDTDYATTLAALEDLLAA